MSKDSTTHYVLRWTLSPTEIEKEGLSPESQTSTAFTQVKRETIMPFLPRAQLSANGAIS